jgi:enoyl-CoA hydratase
MTDEALELVRYEARHHTAIITLNRPKARNAINPEMAVAIESALDRSEAEDDVWTVVITSSSSTFCAGADLSVIASGSFAGIETKRGGFAGVVRRERTKPMLAAVDGPALAGGCEIALSCDLIVASTASSFGLPEVKRSLVAAAGGLMRLPRVLPLNVAMEMALTGEPISAEQASELGMVNRLTAPGGAIDGALELAEDINRAAPLAVRASRQTLLECLQANEEDGWRIGWRNTKPLFATEDFQEGPRAFLEKRPAQWRAR